MSSSGTGGGNGGPPRVGVYVCHCGTNIAKTVDVESVAEFAATLPNVAVARHYRFNGKRWVRYDPSRKG